MTDSAPSAADVAREINRVLRENPSAAADIGSNDQVQRTIRNINSLDQNFQQQGGIFFHTGSNAFETAEKFTQIHVDQYRQTGRPSLPALAMHHAEMLGLDHGSPEYKAMIMVAVRAEMEASVKPDYHSKYHYTDVAAMTANLLEKNNEMVREGKGVPLTKEEQALTFMSAIGHDIDHEGKGNPPDDPLFNEKKSFSVMEPILRDAGLTENQIAQSRTILMTTSPNGPHAILKIMAQGMREGAPLTVGEIHERDREYNNQGKNLAAGLGLKDMDFTGDLNRLDSNPKLIQMAAMVSDSDLYASGGAGMKANAVMSKLLTDEGAKYNNSKLDFSTDGSRKFFLDGIVGKEGFASDAGRATANEMFEAMRTETNERLKAAAAAKAAEAPKPGPDNGGGNAPAAPGAAPPDPGAAATAGANASAAPNPNPAAGATPNTGDSGQPSALKTTGAAALTTTAVGVETKAIPPAPEVQGPPAASRFMGEPKAATTGEPRLSEPGGVGGTGAGVVGLVLSGKGLNDAIRTGDKTEMAIAGTNLATATAQTTESVLAAAGESLPVLSKATKFVPGLNVAATVVDGAYQISKEDTTEHKVERGVVVGATTATGLALGAATATAAETGAVTTGVAAVLGTGAAATGTAAVIVAAAPVVATAAAVTAVAYTGEKAIEAKRAWDEVDRNIATEGAATRRRNYQSKDGKPSVLGFKHIAVMMLHHSEDMKNGNMNGVDGMQRDPQGRFMIQDFNKIDMRDPKNIAELERVLNAAVAKEDGVIQENDSVLPKWMRMSSSVDKLTNAQMEQADLKGALQELQMYKKELKDWDAAHPDDPATTGVAPRASPAAAPAQPKAPRPRAP